MTVRWIVFSAALLSTVAACGDGGAGPDPDADGATVSIEGGTVTSADGKVTLVVPPGALAQATAIRIRRAPESGDPRLLRGSEYLFEPDGLRFAAPARLTIRFDSIPAALRDQAPYIWLHRREGTGWAPMVGEPIDLPGRAIRGELDGFSSYGGATTPFAGDLLLAAQQLAVVLNDAIPQNVIGLLSTIGALLQSSDHPAFQALVRPVLDQMATTACNAFAAAVNTARSAPVDDWNELTPLLAPVYSWEAVVVKLGMPNGCPNPPLTLAQIQTLKIDQFVTFYLSRLDPGSLSQNFDRLIAEVGFVVGLRADLELMALDQYDQALVTDAQYPLMRQLRATSYAVCRDQGRHEYLGRLRSEVALSDYEDDDLLHDLQQCATRLSWRVLADDRSIDENGVLGGGDTPGAATVLASASGVRSGTLALSGDVRAFRCPDGSFAGDELIVTLDGQEVHRRTAQGGSFFPSPFVLDVEALLQQAGVDPDRPATVPLVLSRESGGCAQYVEAVVPVPLAELRLAYPQPNLYRNDFSGTAGAEWSMRTIATSPSGERFLGHLGNAGPDLTLTGLAPHTRIRVEFDVYIIRTWDGNNMGPGNGPDVITFLIDDVTRLRTTFSNVNDRADHRQSYPDAYPADNAAGSGATAINSLGYQPGSSHHNGDATYRLVFDIEHTAPTVKVSFRATGLSSFPDEYWGIDNVRVTTR